MGMDMPSLALAKLMALAALLEQEKEETDIAFGVLKLVISKEVNLKNLPTFVIYKSGFSN